MWIDNKRLRSSVVIWHSGVRVVDRSICAHDQWSEARRSLGHRPALEMRQCIRFTERINNRVIDFRCYIFVALVLYSYSQYHCLCCILSVTAVCQFPTKDYDDDDDDDDD